MALEILDLKGPGTTACRVGVSGGTTARYRAGWEATAACECDNELPTINCNGFGVRAVPVSALLDLADERAGG